MSLRIRILRSMRKCLISAFTCILLASCSTNPVVQQSGRQSPAVSHTLPILISSAQPTPQPGKGPLATTATSNGYLRVGKPDAPLSLTIVTNHACSYCRQFQRDLLPRLTHDFIDTGWLATETVILPIAKYPQSTLYAKALLCGARQGSGALLHDALFDLQTTDAEVLTATAKKLKMNVTEFDSCVADPLTSQLIGAQSGMLLRQNVTLVPTFIMRGEVRVGLPDYADLRGWIERMTREAKAE